MREYGNVCNMTDRELRIYKRKLRRRIQNRRRCFAFVFTFCLIAVLAISVYSFRSSASSKKTEFKYYTRIEVEYGQTLWEIARDFTAPEHYQSVESYMAELQSINHIKEDGDIKAGQMLIIPYFSAEYK
ncbi:MAG: LysM peptidoglycan-binding domain-containing protein [Roseburia sp.]|nr:LysM peptidoglycan-binding domain-containing protein [Roseburia sp.]